MNIDELIEQVKSYNPKVDVERLRHAFLFARKAHAGQTRMSGKAYITHPLEVACILASYRADEDSLIAALLHDVVEDTHHGEKEIEKMFGSTVSKMVTTLTKLPHTETALDNFDAKIESIRKIFAVMQEDVRVIVIKLCDRLHNMSTLNHFRKEKQKRIAQETLDIYVKIADRLGIGDLKERLEEMCHQFLNPESYQEFLRHKKFSKDILKQAKRVVSEKIKKTKHLSHALQIEYRQLTPFDQLAHGIHQDTEIIIAVTVVVKTENECYLALKDVHGLWKGIRGSLRDYITLPKSNGYQALQTMVIKANGRTLSFRIQTKKMYEYSRYGVMLKCFSGGNRGKKIQLPWVQNLKRIHQSTKDKSGDYITALENNILRNSTTVYLSGNKSIVLPEQATILDAAFHAYGKRAWKLNEVLLNGAPASFFHYVGQDDTIQCFFSSRHTLKHEWLDWVDTTLSTSYIKEFLHKNSKPKSVRKGKEILEKTFQEQGRGFIEELSTETLTQLFKKFQVSSLSDLYQKLGEAEIKPAEIIGKLGTKNGKSRGRRMLIKVRGEIDDLKEFYDQIPESVHSDMQYCLTTGKKPHAEIVTGNLSKKEWDMLSLLLKRSERLQVVTKSNYLKRRLRILSVLFVSVLWGLDPIIAGSFLERGIEVHTLLALRFWTASAFMALILIVRNLTQYSYKRRKLVFFSWPNFLLALTLFGVAGFSYLSLQTTFPPLYLIAVYGCFLLTNNPLRKQFRKLGMAQLFVGVMVLSFVLLFMSGKGAWTTEAKMWTALAAIIFSLYSYFAERLQAHMKIFSRYDQLQTTISVYCAVFAGMLYFALPWQQLPLTDFALMIGFASIFTVIPYLLYHYLVKSVEDTSQISYQMFGIMVAVVLGEYFYFSLLLEPLQIVSLALIGVGVVITGLSGRMNKSQKD